MNFKKMLLAASAVVTLPVMAQAQQTQPYRAPAQQAQTYVAPAQQTQSYMPQTRAVTGPYIAGGIGANWLQDTTLNGSVENTVGRKIENEFEVGYIGVLSLGWGFGNGLRAEIEGNYRSNEVSDTKIGGQSIQGRASGSGTATSYGVMANVLYDFDLGSSLNSSVGGIVPYIGAGVGYIWHDYQDVGGTFSDGRKAVYNGDTGAFGYQVILGLALPIESVPGLAVTAEYRFMGTLGHDINGTVNATGEFGGKGQERLNSEVDNFNHSLLIGLRYAFNAAPVVAAAAVAPLAAARTYLVFFDWSKANLTDRARQIIGEAATARGQGVTRIEVNGFTDRSGSDRFNQGLSERRANAVAAELVRRGVPRNEIVTRGFGEANNLVPTADGVREPQNRRVEIILK